jgi:hypothetical protein
MYLSVLKVMTLRNASGTVLMKYRAAPENRSAVVLTIEIRVANTPIIYTAC